jgi:hypothetical protein
MKRNLAIAFAFAVLAGQLPANAQYHYSYGNSRVVNQSQTGLYTPSSTYIGAGTLSRSAQGKAAGIGADLPVVNMGSHVRTAGDNLYNGNGTDRMGNGALIYKDQEAAIAARQRAKYLRQQQAAMMRQRAAAIRQQQGYFYVPGSNGATATYGTAGSGGGLQFRNGAATYGDNFGSSAKTVRQF